MARSLGRRLCAALLMAVPSLLCSASTRAAVPGRARWTVTYDVHVDKVNGAPAEDPETQHKQQRMCDYPIAKEAMERMVTSDFGEGCAMTRFSFSDGTISFAGSCPKKGDRSEFTLAGSGTYSANVLHIDITARGMADGDDLEVSGTVNGTRTGRCT